MKQVISFLLLLAVIAFAGIEAQAASKQSKKILIVYYSWSGNTRAMAQQIQKYTGGDLVEITAVKPYPSDYKQCVKQAKAEVAAGFHPAIRAAVKDLASYSIVFVGTPNWWSNIAPPVASFLSSHQLAGKKVIPFVTHGGGGVANCVYDIKKLCPRAKVTDAKDIAGDDVRSSQAEITRWLKGIKMLK